MQRLPLLEGCSGISAGASGAAQTILALWSGLWSGESGCCLHHRGQGSIISKGIISISSSILSVGSWSPSSAATQANPCFPHSHNSR